jgi:hypothetical protein
VSSVHQVRTVGDSTGFTTGPSSGTSGRATSGRAAYGQADLRADDTLVDQAMVERAKSVIVVAERVGEDEATQILFDAANEADVPVRLVADQVMTALCADGEEGIAQDTPMRDTLVRALGVIRPSERPQT